MIFALILIVFVGAIAFFHYIQGLFSATLSAVLAVISAVLAMAYFEPLTDLLLAGKISDYAQSLVLLALFAAIYTVLRLIFDAVVPGNIRFPALVDKIGAGVMGVIAGVFATGIVAIAAQMMPFGTTIGMYSRFETETRPGLSVPPTSASSGFDGSTYDELASTERGRFDEAKRTSMIVPVDNMVVSTVSYLSEGALSGARPLSSVHENLLDEAFGQRIGIQTGAKHTIFHNPEKNVTSITSVELLAPLGPFAKQISHEIPGVRDQKEAAVPLSYTKTPSLTPVIVRMRVSRAAGDDKIGIVRVSPGSIRLVGKDKDGRAVNYHPVASVENGNTLVMHRMDDYLFIMPDKAADFLFEVKDEDVINPEAGPKLATPAWVGLEVKNGVVLNINRMARIDLSGKKLAAYTPTPDLGLLRKGHFAAAVSGTLTTPGTPGATPTPTPEPEPQKASLRTKLIGNWGGSNEAGGFSYKFDDDGAMRFVNSPKQGLPLIKDGQWKVTNEDAKSITIECMIDGRVTAVMTITFDDDNTLSFTTNKSDTKVKLIRQ